MKYFYYEPNIDIAVQQWENFQFDLTDIVLALTDNHIFIGAKIYAIFCRPEVLNLMKYYVCDFAKIKEDLGINGNYVKRQGNIYSKTFNPTRSMHAITFSIDEIKNRAKNIYKNIMLDLSSIVKSAIKQ